MFEYIIMSPLSIALTSLTALAVLVTAYFAYKNAPASALSKKLVKPAESSDVNPGNTVAVDPKNDTSSLLNEVKNEMTNNQNKTFDF